MNATSSKTKARRKSAPAKAKPRRRLIPVYDVALSIERSILVEQTHVAKPYVAADIFRKFIGKTKRQRIYVMMLDKKDVIDGIYAAAPGWKSMCCACEPSILVPAVLAEAKSVIVCHTHPGTNPQFCNSDLLQTAALEQLGKALGITVRDNIILGDRGGYLSIHAECPGGLASRWRSVQDIMEGNER